MMNFAGSTPENNLPRCRFCKSPLQSTFVDLGMSPLCESYIQPDRLDEMERFFPLHVRVCDRCLLVQLPEFVSPEEIFTEYAYFSSYSDSWLQHASRYVETITPRLQLSERSFVVELGSNDGYLLKNFVEKGIPALGIEPARNVADAAIQKGVATLVSFFGVDVARQLRAEGQRADLIVANNVLAQVPDVNDFVAGIAVLLGRRGVATLEFPHLMRLVDGNQFDTIYHEHYSYFSFATARRIFEAHGLKVFDVEELPTHGGSLRVYLSLADNASQPVGPRVAELADREREAGFATPEPYSTFSQRVEEVKRELLDFLILTKRQGKKIAGYGAPGKGNTLLNYCGIRTDFLDYTVDRNPYKQGLALPGTHIPIFHPDRIAATRPDYILILPWNLKNEILEQLAYVRKWGGRFLVPIPQLEVLE
jgi:C-methyltransferase C-terminal domain/Putative zinc binding domain/Methyltransferase domain